MQLQQHSTGMIRVSKTDTIATKVKKWW